MPITDIKKVMNGIESWEKTVKEYESKHQKVIDDDMKSLAMQELLPTDIQNHIFLNSNTLNSYNKIRGAVESYVNMKVVEDPMEVDYMGKDRKGKGKGDKGKDKKGKGKGNCTR